MHGGFVGMGMLDAACPGAVFTSPTPDQMLEATKAIGSGQGVLHIVKNYTGDIMNFELAAELARGEDIPVESVVINDDVAVKDSLYTAGTARRRHDRARGEDRRRGGGGGPVAGRGESTLRTRQRAGAQHGSGADELHRPARGQADVRAAGGRDGTGRRHPRRAGPPATPACPGGRQSPRC